MLVKIDNSTALEMLLDRLEYWTDDNVTYRLYEQMYESYIEDGVFEYGEFDVMQIVDNDYINYCHVISEDDEHYSKIKELYNNGEYDVSCEDLGYSFIEAEYDGYFLVRA